MIKIMIVDDHESVHMSYKIALEKNADLKVIECISNADSAYERCLALHPDLVLMDVCTDSTPNGLSAAKIIKEKLPSIKIIMMTGFKDVSYIPKAIAYQADALVEKDESFANFIQVIMDVMSGKKRFPDARKIPVPQGEAPLTNRETEILRLIMDDDLTTEEIAEQLYISVSTVNNHIHSILSKTGARSMFSLATKLRKEGWIK